MNVSPLNQSALTPRQDQLYRFVADRLAAGKPPSTREMAMHMGCSQPNVIQLLKVLERMGFVEREKGCARGIVLSQSFESENVLLFDVPILGHITAGSPETVAEHREPPLRLDLTGMNVRHPAKLFALRVRGDSMIDAHILEGDLAIMDVRDPVPEDIVAALIDAEVTLKRYVVKPGGKAHLKAENARYPDLHPVTELQIQGIMIALIRGRK